MGLKVCATTVRHFIFLKDQFIAMCFTCWFMLTASRHLHLTSYKCYNARNITDQLHSLEIEEEVSQLGTQCTLTKYVTSGPWGITKKTTIIEHLISSLRCQKSLLSQCGNVEACQCLPKASGENWTFCGAQGRSLGVNLPRRCHHYGERPSQGLSLSLSAPYFVSDSKVIKIL